MKNVTIYFKIEVFKSAFISHQLILISAEYVLKMHLILLLKCYKIIIMMNYFQKL